MSSQKSTHKEQQATKVSFPRTVHPGGLAGEMYQARCVVHRLPQQERGASSQPDDLSVRLSNCGMVEPELAMFEKV